MIKSLGKVFAKLVASHVELHASETCPECGSQWAREVDDPDRTWRCLNPDCPRQVLQRLGQWAAPEAMNVAGCDEALVRQLFDQGLVRDAAEFYQLSRAELAAVAGISEATARALVAELEASREREAWRVLAGLGIPKIGAAEARALCRHFDSLHELFAAGRERVLALPDVDAAALKQMNRWLGDPVNRKLVRRLAKAGVNFKC